MRAFLSIMIKKTWELSFGTYPGILFGMRTYYAENATTYVAYLPFIDIALVIVEEEE